MLCAECGRETQEPTCTDCGGDARLHERYQLQAVLGSHGGGSTYRAIDEAAGQPCVVKELQLRATKELKELELFEREAEMLASLDHPRIPKLRDHFEVRRGKSIALYMVIDFVDGPSLERELADRRFTESEVASVLADLVDLLEILRTREPPVVHRDIKPANLLRTADGIVLVDFGASRAVAETLHNAGSTVSGTFGYMAPEQLVGQSSPASDLFAAGATALRLLTGKEPGDLWGDAHRFVWDHSNIDSRLAGAITALTEPHPDDRPTDLTAFAADLRGFAGGESRALVRFAGHAVAKTKAELDRPSTRPAWRRLRRTALPFALFDILMLIGFVTLLMNGELGPNILAVLFAGVVTTIVTIAFLTRSYARWRLLSRGDCTRGVVVSREVKGAHFHLTYSYRVGDETFTRIAQIEEDEFFGVQPGEEVAVCYRASAPGTSTAALLPDHKRLPS